MFPLLLRASAAVLVGLVLSCGGGPTVGVVHLEPVELATGAPSAAGAEQELEVARVEFGTELEGWGAQGALVRVIEPSVPAARAFGLRGVRVEPAEGTGVPRLTSPPLDWEADRIDALVLEAAFDNAGLARIYFHCEDVAAPEADAPPAATFEADYVEVAVQPSRRLMPLEVPMDRHPRWRGRVKSLRLDLVPGPRAYTLASLAAVARQFEGATSPELDAAGQMRDGGLVQLAFEKENEPNRARYEARRAYPARAGAPQRIELPTSSAGTARLDLSFALPRSERRRVAPVAFRVEEPAGRVLFEAVLDPERDAQRWRTGFVDIAGDPKELRLVAESQGAAAAGDLVGLWGPITLSYPKARRPPSVLLITADTLRADHVSAYARALGLEPAAKTPVIDGLIGRGTAFVDTLASNNATSPSHATILTGLYPKDHTVLGNQALLPEAVTTLPEILKARGWWTLAGTTVRHLSAALSGMGQGVDLFFDTPPMLLGEPPAPHPEPWLAARQAPLLRSAYRGAAELNPEFFDALEETGERPFFAWLHYYDPHTPYSADEALLAQYVPADAASGETLLEQLARRRAALHPELAQFRDGDVQHELDAKELAHNFAAVHAHLEFLGDVRSPDVIAARYAAGVAQLDRDIGRVFDELKRRGRLDDTLIVFTSDHGEALGEHDIWYDHQGLIDENLRVPLVFAGPGVPARGLVAGPVETVDILPTVCELLDVPAPREVVGRSLVPELGGAPLAPRVRWFQHASGTEAGYQDETSHVVLTLVDHPKGTLDIRVSAGDLLVEPRGPGALPPRAEAEQRVRRWLETRAVDVRAQGAPLSGSDLDALRRLGYVGEAEEAD